MNTTNCGQLNIYHGCVSHFALHKIISVAGYSILREATFNLEMSLLFVLVIKSYNDLKQMWETQIIFS